MENSRLDLVAKRTKRSSELIANFVDGYAEGWCFAVKENFKRELNIELTERKKEKVSYLEWTQGPYYCFSEGQIFYDAIEGYNCWKDALLTVNLACQIIEAKPNVPLKLENELTGKSEFKVLDGYVKFTLYKPNEVRTNLVKFQDHSCTQNEFINFLKTGAL